MNKRYFTADEFNDNFGKEMAASQDVFESMKRNDLQDYQYCQFDFNFISDSKEKLAALGNFLRDKYHFTDIEIKKMMNYGVCGVRLRHFQLMRITSFFGRSIFM